MVERPGFRLAADLAVASGAAVAVIGPSGSGKTTLLDLVAGFVAPAAGAATTSSARPLAALCRFAHIRSTSTSVFLVKEPSEKKAPAMCLGCTERSR